MSRAGTEFAGLRRAAAACLLILASGIGSSIATAQDSTAPLQPMSRAVDEAEAAIRDNEPQLAESRFRTALLEGWLLMGAIAKSDGDWDAARTAYNAAMSSATEARRARLLLADTHIRIGETTEAIRLLRKIVGKDMQDVQARRLLAQALAAEGQLAESVLELEALRNMYPDDPESRFLLGAAYLRQERLEDAVSEFEELVRLKPIPQTHVLLTRTYRDFEQFDDARAAAQAALELDSEVPRAHYYLGTIEFLEHSQAGLPRAIEHFQAELRVSPDDLSTNLYLGMSLVDERRDEEAIAPLEVAANDPESEKDALYFLGRAYLRVGRVDEAIPALTRALELLEAEAGPDIEATLEARRQRQLSQLHYQLGTALRRSGDEAAAEPHFEAAAESMARETEDSRERLRRYLEDDIVVGSQEAFFSPVESTLVAELSPGERAELRAVLTYRLAQAYLNLGVLQVHRRRIPRAADLFQQAADLAPNLPQVQYSLGVARFNSNQFEQAIHPLQRTLETDPSNLQVRRMLALAAMNAKQYEQAAELLEDDPDRESDRTLQYAYGVALVRSGRAAEAEQVFAELVAENEDWPELHVVLGLAAAQQDDFDAAIASLERAIELKPDVAEAHSTLGEIHMRHGRLDEAALELRTELEYRPDDLQSQNLLATVLEMAGDSEEALRLLDAILAAAPRTSSARYLKGKILLAEGEAEAARVHLEAAARLSPEDPEIHYQLGTALQRLGRAEEAREEFATYQSLKRNQPSGDSP